MQVSYHSFAQTVDLTHLMVSTEEYIDGRQTETATAASIPTLSHK